MSDLAGRGNNTNRIKEEAADLLYHLLVLLVNREIALKDVISILEQRHKK